MHDLKKTRDKTFVTLRLFAAAVAVLVKRESDCKCHAS